MHTRIGLEVHIRLNTISKIFSCASNLDSYACRVDALDAAIPGTLPILNFAALLMSYKLGIALDAKINTTTLFNRKSYIYPDIPKGYQITQDKFPVFEGGKLKFISSDNQIKYLPIIQGHLEEDAAKIIHKNDYDAIDYTRSGRSLLELVTTPCLSNIEDVIAALKYLRAIVRYLEISDANMELGEFRVDVNVSISDSLISMGTKCEIKNLNSFTSIASAIKAELNRQRNIIENGDKVSQCTLGFDVSKGKTYLLRTKEKEYEYNYIYDPDLPPLIVSNTVVEEIQRSTIVFDIESLLEYPVDSRNFILERPYIMNFYSDCLKTLSHKSIFTWVCNEIWKLTGNKSKFQSILMDIKTFTQAVLIYEKGACSISLLRDWLVNNLFKEGSDLSSLLYTNLVEDKFIKSVFLEILKEHTALLDQYRNGNDKALHYLTGILIQDIKKRYSGTIDSKLCAQIVKLILEEYK